MVSLFLNEAYAQAPEGFNYQSVVRDATGNPVTQKSVTFRFSIIQHVITNNPVYMETADAETNQQGLVSLMLGQGTPSLGLFSQIQWSDGPFYLKVEVDFKDGAGFVGGEATPLLSVPYALYAKSAGQPLVAGPGISIENSVVTNTAPALPITIAGENGMTVTGTYPNFVLTPPSTYWAINQSGSIYPSNGGSVGIGTSTPNGMLEVMGTDSDPTVPLFEVKDINGNPVFAVYPDGVEITVDLAATGRPAKGGFAVSGRNSTRGTVTDILRVTPDSTTVYVNNSITGRPAKGGFAVSGRNSTRAGVTSNIITITQDSTRIYTADPLKGFGVGQTAGVAATNYLRLTPNNYFIGQQTGYSINKGQYNVFLGYQAGYSTTGYHDDMDPTDGDNNIFIGYQAGYANTVGEQNLYIGAFSGKNNTNGSVNTFVGSLTGQNNTGYGNTFLGAMAGGANQSNSGYRNTFVGCYSGQSNSSGSDNVFIGRESGSSNTTGSYNVYIGHLAGLSNSSGTGNVFIGRAAGQNETGSNKLYITNTTADTLIYGDFLSKQVIINGSAVNLSRGLKFFVNGAAGGTLSWSAISDRRLKTDITTISDALNKVLKLNGVNFHWKDTTQGTALQMGFIAQDVEKVVPEVVTHTKESDTYSMQYAPVTALLVEAMKEQQKTIEQLKKENEELRKQVQEILDMLKTTKK